MTLQSDGPLKASQIQAEFGGANPFRLSDYYAGGANVPGGTTGDGGPIPSSGTIKFSDFYGSSNTPSALVKLIGDSLFDFSLDPTDSGVGYQVSNNGTERSYENNSGTFAFINTWRLSGVSGDYECRLTVNSGTAPSGSAVNAWLSCGTTRSWTLARTTVGILENNCTIEIRLAAGSVLQDAAQVTMKAEVSL